MTDDTPHDPPPYAVYPLDDADIPDDPEALAGWCVSRVAHAGKLLDRIPLETLEKAYRAAAAQDTFGASLIADVLATAIPFRHANEVVRELADLLPDDLPSSRPPVGDVS